MSITKKQFTALSDLYEYYNHKLFLGELPECMVSLVRAYEYHGAFSPNRWIEKNSDTQPIHEIVLNANTMTRPDKAWHSTLVHEMAHLYIQVNGKATSRGYHCKRWAAKMKHIGLHPSHNGMPGGKETGRRVTHYIIEGGAFEKAFNKISAKDIAKYNLPYQSLIGLPTSSAVVASAAPHSPVPESRSGVKVGYECTCGNKVWGKAGLELLCWDCLCDFTVISKQSK